VGGAANDFGAVILDNRFGFGIGNPDGELGRERPLGLRGGRALQGNEPNLVGYYRFDEGFGMVAKDSSPTMNSSTFGDGIASKSPQWVAAEVPLCPAN
jgi:hypothetical protein